MEKFFDPKIFGTLLLFVAALWLISYLMKPKAAASTATDATTSTTTTPAGS
jgi:hypothetical protein